MEEITISSHFFHVLTPGFREKLNLPPDFSIKLKREKSKSAVLLSRKGRWKVEVVRNGKGHVISFEFGWPQFVDQHSLSLGDVLVFEHIGGLTFNVVVFGRSYCEKEFVIESREDSTDEKAVKRRRREKTTEREKEEETVTLFDSGKPNFITTVNPLPPKKKKARMNIPIEFVRSNNLWNKTSVALRTDDEVVWPTSLWIQKSGQARVCLAGKGWVNFYDSNDLKAGDVCVFYLNLDSLRSGTILFDVKISRN